MLTAILVPALSRGVERQRQAVVRASGAQPAPAYIHSVRVQRDRADINGQGTGDYSLVLEIGAPGAATTWAAGLGQGPLTAFDAVLAPVAPDWTRLQFAVTRRGGGVAQYIDLASVRGLPQGRVVFRTVQTGTIPPEADGSYVVADLVPDSGPALPIAVSLRPTREVAATAPAPPGFGPVIEKVISTEDADGQGLVFLDMETGKSARPPFPLTLRPGQGPGFVELTPELTKWIRARDVDLLLRLGDRGWDLMTLDMQQDFAGQLDEWETVSPAAVVALFAQKDAVGQVRDAVPAGSFSHGYGDGFGALDAFRTRRDTMGVYQFEGVENSTRRGVRLRYKLLLPATDLAASGTPTPPGGTPPPPTPVPGPMLDVGMGALPAGGTPPDGTTGMMPGLVLPVATKPGHPSKPGVFAPGAPASVLMVRREVNRKVADFPEPVDLSTPESACAAFHRAGARLDVEAWNRLTWVPFDVAATKAALHAETEKDSQAMAGYLKAVADATIVEVLNWGADLAATVTRLPLPAGQDTRPYSARVFGRINGQWKNMGEDRLPTQEAARASFEEKKEALWQRYQELAEELAPVRAEAEGK
jgi:hypothetical protein